MRILSLNPGVRRLAFALFEGFDEKPMLRGEVPDYRGEMCEAAIETIVHSCNDAVGEGEVGWAWAVRIPFGGEMLGSSVMLSEETTRSLKTLIHQRPLHLPAIVGILDILNEEYGGMPVALAFDTAFFTALPSRESRYALNADSAGPLRRFGQYGLFHRAACAHVRSNRRKSELGRSAKILSVCLEPNPELAAVIGSRPVMVTSGLTPLEGLPGRTTCGELDPGIVITLKNKMKWGPERIGEMLTKESGLLGLTGEPADIEQVMTSQRYDGSLAKEVMNYRFLLACGAGMAAMGGLDDIVFSGRHASTGSRLGPGLISRIFEGDPSKAAAIRFASFGKSIERVVADEAAAMFIAASGKDVSSAKRFSAEARPI